MPHNIYHISQASIPGSKKPGIVYGKRTGRKYNAPKSSMGRASMAMSGQYQDTLPVKFGTLPSVQRQQNYVPPQGNPRLTLGSPIGNRTVMDVSGARPAMPLATQHSRPMRLPQVNPQQAARSARMPQLGQRGVVAPSPAPVSKLPAPKKMNTETNAQYQARLQRLGANPAASSVPSSGGLQKLNTESNAQFEARKLRHADGYTPPPSRANLNPTSPSDAMQLGFADLERQMEEGALPFQVDQQRRMDEYAQRTAATPQRPQVDESLLSRLPSRSERDRSSMQPGGMGDGGTFDAMAAREREDRLAPQRALAQREDVTAEDGKNFTRTVDRDPNSPTFGQAKVVGATMYGPSVPDEVRALIDDNDGDASILYTENGRDARKALNAAREPRRKARLAGEIYTDPATGAVSDYGRFNEAREARQERKDAARELRTRAAQLQNYGRTGGVMVNPSGGIAGPMFVGNQATFGPNMSRNQAIRMAQGQMDQEERASDALRRIDQQQAMNNRLQAAQAMQDGPAKDAVLKQINDDILQPSDGSLNEYDEKYGKVDKRAEQGQYRKAPARKADTLGEEKVDDRQKMGGQVIDFLNDDELSDQEKKDAILRQYPELETEEGIDNFVSGTTYDSSILGDSLLNDRLRGIMGLPTEKEKEEMRIDVFGPDPTNNYLGM